MGDDQRHRPRRILDIGAGLADEVDALRADVDQVVGPAVDRLLAALPVVAVAPVVDQAVEEFGIGAGGPVPLSVIAVVGRQRRNRSSRSISARSGMSTLNGSGVS
jgi:hypothetical protein